MKYIEFTKWFWWNIPFREGYKSDYAVLFHAIMDSVNKNFWLETPIPYEIIINKTGISKRSFLDGRRWLYEQGLITFESGINHCASAKYKILVVQERTANCTTKRTSTAPLTAPLYKDKTIRQEDNKTILLLKEENEILKNENEILLKKIDLLESTKILDLDEEGISPVEYNKRKLHNQVAEELIAKNKNRNSGKRIPPQLHTAMETEMIMKLDIEGKFFKRFIHFHKEQTNESFLLIVNEFMRSSEYQQDDKGNPVYPRIESKTYDHFGYWMERRLVKHQELIEKTKPQSQQKRTGRFANYVEPIAPMY